MKMTQTKLLSRLRDDVLDAMEQAYIKGKNEQLTLTDVVDCKHDNEIMRQGDGFVYSTCGDCGDEL